VGPVHFRSDLPCFEELPENRQVRGVLLCTEDAQLLTHQRGERNGPELAVEVPQPPFFGLASDDDQLSARGEGPTET
jgi:hypothetical protein